MTGPEADAAARLLERLLTDPDLRERFRHDPVAASRDAGAESVAREMSHAAGKAMETLDGRESRSSLAGVFMAAALEGVAGYGLVHDAVPHLAEIPASVGQVLSRVDLPAIPGLGVEPAHAASPGKAAGEFKVVSARDDVDVLHNDRVSLDADGIADIRSGSIDPRVTSVLTAISRDHEITVSAMKSDHDKFTSGGSISNHWYGRAFDIATVDGQPVGPGNQAAREVAMELSRLPSSIRPSEIGSPWALPGAAYFTDSAHQDHLHVGFDDPIAGGWTPPDDLGPSGEPQEEVADDSAPDVAEPVPASQDAGDDGGDDDDADEPGGLEDPGGDTDAEADAESDGDGDEESDDESDDEEDEEDDESDWADEHSSEGDDGDDGSSDDGSSDDGSSDDGSSDEDGDGGGAQKGGDPGAPLDLGGVANGYPGDDASQEEIAAWMGHEAQKRGLPPELPVMAGLVESNLRNLGYGDADSVGFFQMRVGIWNQGDYAGYPERPELQLDWFLDTAEAVKRQGGGSDDPSGYGEWVANVERPAEQYRGRYQLRMEEARGLLREGQGQGQGPAVEDVATGGGRSAGPRARAALAEARKYLGTPYQWGGSTPRTGFDCSGLVQWAYAKAGIKIPRVTDQQFEAPGGNPVGRNRLLPGDLVFFRDSSGYIHHVGMSLGGDRFIHAPHTGDVVKVSSLNESYYAGQFAGGRRFAAGASEARTGAAGADQAQTAAPDVDPVAVRDAEAAVAREAAEVQRSGTVLWKAVRAQEIRKANAGAGMFRAVRPPSS